MTWDVPQNLEEPHHAELVVSVDELDALLRQSRSANCRQLELRMYPPQRSGDSGRMQITGRFAGDKKNLTHGGACVRPTKAESARSPSRSGARHPAPVSLLRRLL